MKTIPPASSVSALSRQRHGFTLTELLVALAIIVILLGILFPTARTMREWHLNTGCVAKLRSIGAGLHAYINDHNGEFPPCAALPNSGYKISYRKGTFWFDALNPYMGYPQYAPDRQEQFPPADAVGTEFPLPWQLCPAKRTEPLERQAVGYGWNSQNFGHDLSRKDSTGFGARIQEIANPSRVIIIGDSVAQPGNSFQHRYIYDASRESRYPYPDRHFGKGNYLFVDGHVEAFTPEFIKSPEGIQLFKRQ